MRDDDLLKTQGEPFAGPSIYAQYRVFKTMKENNVRVSLDGQGADEIFGGYNGYPGYRMHSLLDKNNFVEMLYFLNAWSKYTNHSRVEGIKRLIDSITTGKLNQFLRNINKFMQTKIILEISISNFFIIFILFKKKLYISEITF